MKLKSLGATGLALELTGSTADVLQPRRHSVDPGSRAPLERCLLGEDRNDLVEASLCVLGGVADGRHANEAVGRHG